MNLPELPGEKLDVAMESYLKQAVGQLCNCKPSRFPGAQPVSFERRHIESLREENYFVAEKSDGIRCLLLSLRSEDGFTRTVLIGRKNEYRYVSGLVLATHTGGFHNMTLLDGELVTDTEPDGKQRQRYLAFDLIALENESQVRRTLDKRLGSLRTYVIKPHDKFMQLHSDYAEQIPFSLEAKHVETAYHMSDILKIQIPQLKHGNDGLIFTAQDAAYSVGECRNMLKWKPASENSIDFRLYVVDPETSEPWIRPPKTKASAKRHRSPPAPLNDGNNTINKKLKLSSITHPDIIKVDDESEVEDGGSNILSETESDLERAFEAELTGNDAPTAETPSTSEIPRLTLYVLGPGGVPSYWSDMIVSDSEWQMLLDEDELDGRIVECTRGADEDTWNFMRFRDDKPEPNFIDIATKIVKSITDGVESDELISSEPLIRSRWKDREKAKLIKPQPNGHR